MRPVYLENEAGGWSRVVNFTLPCAQEVHAELLIPGSSEATQLQWLWVGLGKTHLTRALLSSVGWLSGT